MKKPQHIPRKEYQEIMERFMNYLRELDKIYKETQLKRLKAGEIRAIIDDIINTICMGQSKFFIRQIKSYEYVKYLKHIIGVTKRDIGEMLGYTVQNRHSAVIYNCMVIENYLEIKDKKYYELITLIDERIERILK